MIAPCKDCPNRHTACQDTCEDKKKYDEYRAELKRKEKEAKEYSNISNGSWIFARKREKK